MAYAFALHIRAFLGLLLLGLFVEYVPWPSTWTVSSSSFPPAPAYAAVAPDSAPLPDTLDPAASHQQLLDDVEIETPSSPPAAAASILGSFSIGRTLFGGSANGSEQHHATSPHHTCSLASPLSSSVVELMKASNRTVHLLSQVTKQHLEEAQNELAAKSALAKQLQQEVERLMLLLSSERSSRLEEGALYREKLQQVEAQEAELQRRRDELQLEQAAVKEAELSLEQKRSRQVEEELKLGVRQQELDEQARLLKDKERQHAKELSELQDRHAAELAERHTRVSQCGASLGRVTASLEERERQLVVQDKKIADLEQQLLEAKLQEKVRAAEAAAKLVALQQQLRKQEEKAAQDLAALQQQLDGEKQRHQHTALELTTAQQRERRQALEAAAELHRTQRQLAEKTEVAARQQHQLSELKDENEKLVCKADRLEAAVSTLEDHLLSLNQAMEESAM